MADQILEPLYPRLLEAEEKYEADIHELDGLEKVIRVLGELGRSRERREQQEEDVEPLDQLIGSSDAKLRMVLDCMEQNKDHGVNFHEWAIEIQTDLRAHDPLMVSMDLDGSPSARARRNNRPTDATSRSTADILAILKSNGKLQEKEEFKEVMSGDRFFFLTTLAWSIAVIGTLITIGFLSADFWYAQQNAAIQIERSEPTPLELPAITMCSNLHNVPTFVDYPTKDFPGLPLFGITTYIRFNRSAINPMFQITYPDTLSNASASPIEDVIVSEDSEKCSNGRKGFDVRREMRSLHWIRSTEAFQGFSSSRVSCLHCFRIGYKRRELLEPYKNETAILSPAVQIKVFKSRMFGACQTIVTRRDPLIDRMFATELELFAKNLDNRGILDFNGQNYSVLSQTQRDIRHPQHIDFYCNVYFFSGFFYPSLDNASISYRYEPESEEKWVKSGNGPYYSVYSWNNDDPLLHGPNSEVLERDTYAISALQIFAEEASTVNSSRAVLPQTSLSVLDSPHRSIFTFKKVDRHGKNEFEVKEATTETLTGGWRVMDEYYLGFDYETFATEIIMTMATMSWPEYITDVFEFVGLFTGICIFTLIIVPAHSFGFRGAQ